MQNCFSAEGAFGKFPKNMFSLETWLYFFARPCHDLVCLFFNSRPNHESGAHKTYFSPLESAPMHCRQTVGKRLWGDPTLRAPLVHTKKSAATGLASQTWVTNNNLQTYECQVNGLHRLTLAKIILDNFIRQFYQLKADVSGCGNIWPDRKLEVGMLEHANV